MEIDQRFKGFTWASRAKETNITVLGAGGICSFFLQHICKLVRAVNLYEFGVVKEQNVGSQLYSREHLNKHKTEAINSIISGYSDSNFLLNTYGKYEKSDPVNPITVVGPDNMEARKNAYESWKNLPDKKLFIDGRLTIEGYQVYVVDADNTEFMKRYEEEFLFPDDEAAELPCTTRATSFVGAMVASTMVQAFLNYLAKDEFRVLPSMVAWDGRFMCMSNEI